MGSGLIGKRGQWQVSYVERTFKSKKEAKEVAIRLRRNPTVEEMEAIKKGDEVDTAIPNWKP